MRYALKILPVLRIYEFSVKIEEYIHLVYYPTSALSTMPGTWQLNNTHGMNEWKNEWNTDVLFTQNNTFHPKYFISSTLNFYRIFFRESKPFSVPPLIPTGILLNQENQQFRWKLKTNGKNWKYSNSTLERRRTTGVSCMECCSGSDAWPGASQTFAHFIFSTTLWDSCYCLHFTGKETSTEVNSAA